MSRLRELEARGRRGPWLALFDIDSTLMDTTPRNVAILEAAARSIPTLGELLPRLDLVTPFWDIQEPLRRSGLAESSLLTQVKAFWRRRFFSDEWLDFDRPYPGVADFLSDLKAEGFALAYLTGRNSGGMELGTRRSFVRHGLPAGPSERFYFKPNFEMGDGEFKAGVRGDVAALGTLVVAVDNEPANANLFRTAFPEALVVWLDTVTSPEPENLLPGIERRGVDLFLSS